MGAVGNRCVACEVKDRRIAELEELLHWYLAIADRPDSACPGFVSCPLGEASYGLIEKAMKMGIWKAPDE